jgi:hypothetical protein
VDTGISVSIFGKSVGGENTGKVGFATGANGMKVGAVIPESPGTHEQMFTTKGRSKSHSPSSIRPPAVPISSSRPQETF